MFVCFFMGGAMPGVICQNKSVAECLKKESDFFKSLERFEKSNQVESVFDLILRTFD